MLTAYDHLLLLQPSLLKVAASTEGDIDGKIHDEIEFTYYVKLKNVGDLEKAIKVEEHEQWSLPIKTKKDGKVRLRMIDNRRYTMTTKMHRVGKIGWEEVDSDICQDMFNHLKELACNGYKKTRYMFPTPTPGMMWEIDVFRSQGGGIHPWVKVDLEVKDIHQPVPKFPLEHEAFICADDEELTKSQKAFIDELWNSEWTSLDRTPDYVTGKGTSDLSKKEESVLE